ncbi:MAG: hypothetical protein K8R68_06395 [Bacteroidales bacterium]|nr:hypothetical protein [Bacteroidales bacterium]
MKQIVTIVIVFFAITGFSQKKVILEVKSEVIEAATKELDQAMQPPEGELYLFKTENNIYGEYILDITIHEKGKVATVFAAGKKGGTIKSQNRLKDFIKDYRFNFKMPKGKDYKFQYIFKFN